MNNNEPITFAEFRAWLTGLVRGKQGALPDLDDWKAIKSMLDRVEPDKIQVPMFDAFAPTFPWNPIPDPFQQPHTGNPPPPLAVNWPVFGANGFGDDIMGSNSFKEEVPFSLSFRMIGEDCGGTVTLGPDGDIKVSSDTVTIKGPIHVDEEMMNVDEFSIPQMTFTIGETKEEEE